MRISARKLLVELTTETIWTGVTGRFTLVFDDGELETNWRETVDSFYLWEIHRAYPLTPLLTRHHLASLLTNGAVYGVKHQLKLAGIISWDAAEVYAAAHGASIHDELAELTYAIVSKAYSDIQLMTEESVDTVSALDFVQCVTDPRVIEIKERLKVELAGSGIGRIASSIADGNAEIREILMKDPVYAKNALARGCRNGTLKVDQVLQCVGMRGPVTDIDSRSFRVPVFSGFADGFLDFYECFIESRSASKSLMVAQDELQNTEYFSRRLQLQDQQVQNLHRTDCGSTRYLEMSVGEEVVDSATGEITFQGSLDHLLGKRYLNETTGQLDVVTKNSKHLLGKSVKFRSVLHCNHPDTVGICATCFGELSTSVPDKTNIGHYCATSMTQQSSQSVLSTKHLDGRLIIKEYLLDPEAAGFIKLDGTKQLVLFGSRIRTRQPKLLIHKTALRGLLGIDPAADVTNLPRSYFSDIKEICITYSETTPDGVEEFHLCTPLGNKRQKSHLTYRMIDYVRKLGTVQIDADGYVVIPLDDWDWSKEFIYLPLRNFNPSDHSKDIAGMLEAVKAEMEVRDGEISPDEFLIELMELVNDRLNVNMAVLEVILYGLMIRSAKNHDYALPKPWTESGIGVKKLTMENRSMAPGFAYEYHSDAFLNPLSFTMTNRPPHPMDGIVCPKEVYHDHGEVSER